MIYTVINENGTGGEQTYERFCPCTQPVEGNEGFLVVAFVEGGLAEAWYVDSLQSTLGLEA